MAELDQLDDDEREALDAIVRFIHECWNDPEIVEAVIMDEWARSAQAFAARSRGDPGHGAAEAPTAAT